MARRLDYRQMPLPFTTSELDQPVRPVLPPGLREFAAAEQLSEVWVQKLVGIYATARGKPKSIEEWRTLYNVAKKFFGEEPVTHANAP